MGRRHPVTHVQHIDAYTEKYEPAPEYLIEEIIGHKTTKRRVKYRVRWSDGSETWEPKESLIDGSRRRTSRSSTTRSWRTGARGSSCGREKGIDDCAIVVSLSYTRLSSV